MPSITAVVASMSQVMVNPKLSQRAPPRTGPIMVPKAPAILKAAAALSLI